VTRVGNTTVSLLREWRPFEIDRLPPISRSGAALTVLDLTKAFAETPGGVRTYLEHKSRFVSARDDLRHIVIVPGARRVMHDDAGVRWYRLWGPPMPRTSGYRFLVDAAAVSRIVEHERPDIIEVGSPLLAPWIAARAARARQIPLVTFFHTNVARAICPHPDRAGRAARAAGALAWRYARRVSKLSQMTIASSHFLVRELQEAGIERVTRVPLGVDADVFHPSRRRCRNETRRDLNLPDGPLAIYAGRLSMDKELDVLVDAWPAIEQQSNAHLLVMGSGPLETRVQSRLRARRVVWRGFEPDAGRFASVLAAADLYIAPTSTIETFGLTPLEALASGTPVLAAAPGAISELVAASGAGATFRAGDAQSLAEAAIRLFKTDLAAAGALGRSYAEREHAWPIVFDRLFSIYRTIVSTSRPEQRLTAG
jgi:alpha-1,6-mannosyltransferase